MLKAFRILKTLCSKEQFLLTSHMTSIRNMHLYCSVVHHSANPPIECRRIYTINWLIIKFLVPDPVFWGLIKTIITSIIYKGCRKFLIVS
jgi:hypothetical protein